MEMRAIIEQLADAHPYLDTAYFRSIPQFIFHKDTMKTTAIHHCMPHLLSALYVDPKGNAYICDQVVGNLLESDVATIWNEPKRRTFMKELSRAGQCEHPCWLHSHTAKSPIVGKVIQKILS
jgi:sulfatase maturation enzyme AslB (radical SAM superfamily)